MRKAMVIQDDLIRIGRQVHGLVTASLLQQGGEYHTFDSISLRD